MIKAKAIHCHEKVVLEKRLLPPIKTRIWPLGIAVEIFNIATVISLPALARRIVDVLRAILGIAEVVERNTTGNLSSRVSKLEPTVAVSPRVSVCCELITSSFLNNLVVGRYKICVTLIRCLP